MLAESIKPVTGKKDELEKSTKELAKTAQKATKNTKPTLQSSQSQTPKLVSTGTELVQTFSKLNDSKKKF